ncbi:MFS transporter [Arthrobacter sp. CAL618]|uniref:MFS transporter n=1 Tax=Arthrobacter sp. CAL618 TaxID=1055770 RepID=UPI000416FC90|nr:MFS transporter [Arthrobacter sp. CAL618]
MSTSVNSADMQHQKLGQAVFAVGVGNFMEWFDFAVYGFFAVVIGQLFFADQSPVVALLSSLGVFAVGFLMRPLGGFILGPIGDKYGRRAALSFSVLAMGLATTAIGFIPTYADIGLAAPLLLVLMRCIQGLSAGGEWTGSAAFLIEGAPTNRRATYASVISATAALATVAGSGFALWLNNVLTQEQLLDFGWRIPFWAAAPLALVGLFVRLRLDDTPVFKEIQRNRGVDDARKPTVKRNLKAVGLTVCFAAVQGLGYYYLATYVVNYLEVTLRLARSDALMLSAIGLLIYMVLCPLAGLISDRYGRRVPNLIGTIGYVLLPVPVFLLMSTGNAVLIILGLILLGAMQCLVSVTTVVMLVELFPASTRATGSAIGFNIALAFIAGPGPYLGAFLASSTGSPVAPAFYQVFVALVALIILLKWLPESSKQDIFSDDIHWHAKTIVEPSGVTRNPERKPA